MTSNSCHQAWQLLALAVGLLLTVSTTSIVHAAVGSFLERIATIDSKGKPGTLDHLFVDSDSSRLFLTNQTNNTLDVFDLKGGRLLKQVVGQKTAHSVVLVP